MYDHASNNIHAMSGATYAPAQRSIVLHPEHDYALLISKPDEHGNIYVHSPDIPGMHLYGKAAEILEHVPRAVDVLVRANGRRPVCDSVSPVQTTSGERHTRVAVEAYVVTDSVICGYDVNGSPVDDELSKDLIEQARGEGMGG